MIEIGIWKLIWYCFLCLLIVSAFKLIAKFALSPLFYLWDKVVGGRDVAFIEYLKDLWGGKDGDKEQGQEVSQPKEDLPRLREDSCETAYTETERE